MICLFKNQIENFNEKCLKFKMKAFFSKEYPYIGTGLKEK